jgi:hypothetical protein
MAPYHRQFAGPFVRGFWKGGCSGRCYGVCDCIAAVESVRDCTVACAGYVIL